MKIIFQSYNTCCQNKAGGVQIRIRKIAFLLKKQGIDVEFFSPFESDLSTCDVLHIFRLTVENLSLIQSAKRQGKFVVMSAIVPIIRTNKLRFYKALRRLPIVTSYKIMYQSLQQTDLIIVETQAEAFFLNGIYSVPFSKMKVIPNGIDINNYRGQEVFENIGKDCDYILQVGRFDENKNQLNVIRALKNTGIDVVFIGGADHSRQDYYDKCIKEAKGCDNIHFLGWQQKESKVLRSAYSNAKLVIIPSHYETFGLVALEGGIAGANLAFSKALPILCYSSFKDCLTFDPDNVKQMREVLLKAFEQPKNGALKKRLIAEFNWETIIKQHIDIYERNY